MVKTELKSEIKSLAKEIKETKVAHKTAQRDYSKQWYQGEFDSLTWYRRPEKYHQIEPSLRLINSTRLELENLVRNFRIKHIVNSMCKGRTISQIEPKVRTDEYSTYERIGIYGVAKRILEELDKDWLE